MLPSMNPAALLFGTLLAWTVSVHAQNDDVPFVTTPDNVTRAMLDLAGLKQDDYLIDLGSGDGRVVITAAKHFGARGLGVELVPDLVKRSKENALKAGVADRAEFREQDLFATDLSQASVITLYLLPEVNLKLRPMLLKLKPGTRIVSHDWDMGDWKPDQTIVVEAPQKQVGLRKISTLYLWTVPAQVGVGMWLCIGCRGNHRVASAQAYQQLTLSLGMPGGKMEKFQGQLAGNRARLEHPERGAVEVELSGIHFKVVKAEGDAERFAGLTFTNMMRMDGDKLTVPFMPPGRALPGMSPPQPKDTQKTQ
jgi:hypothetical protein